uniref:Nucleotide-binding alpha-beta plait domain-containing protein n=1 Tax=Tanacetum cinerariifolium TaxID=118510 RepID=A0A6L2KW52_TANCI|nr:nucleotide-binding alpha-beta plait domain-containing protein [Tanacetum cinerariifolium]
MTNFPDQYGAKDLWNSCKVANVERLVKNLCTVWVGRYKLYDNVARFQRELLSKYSTYYNNNRVKKGNADVGNNVNGPMGASNSYVHVVKGTQLPKEDMKNNPSLVLDEPCLNQKDYSFCLMGKVKDFASLSNLKVVLVNEGFINIEIKYKGGFWVMIEFQSEGAKKSFQSNLGMCTWFS